MCEVRIVRMKCVLSCLICHKVYNRCLLTYLQGYLSACRAVRIRLNPDNNRSRLRTCYRVICRNGKRLRLCELQFALLIRFRILRTDKCIVPIIILFIIVFASYVTPSSVLFLHNLKHTVVQLRLKELCL